MNIKEQFLIWLEKKAPDLPPSEWYQDWLETEAFCMSQKIISKPLFETTESYTIRKVCNVISSNIRYKIKYLRIASKMSTIMGLYYDFIKMWQKQYLLDTGYKNMNHEERVLPQRSEIIAKQLSNAESQDVNNINAEERAESKDQTHISTIEECRQCPNMIPVAIEYFGDVFECSGWNGAYEQTIRCLKDDYPSVFCELDLKEYDSEDRHLHTLKDSAEDVASYIRDLLEKCNVDLENLKIHCQKNNSQVESESVSDENSGKLYEGNIQVSSIKPEQEQEVTDKDRFKNWLIDVKKKTEQTASNMIYAIDVVSEYAIKDGWCCVSLFETASQAVAQRAGLKAFRNSELSEKNQTEEHIYTSALAMFVEYCKTTERKIVEKNESVQIGVDNESNQQKEINHEQLNENERQIPDITVETEETDGQARFKAWLIEKEKLSESNASVLVDAIKVICEYAINANMIKKSLFDYKSLTVIQKTGISVLGDESFAIKDKEEKYRYSAAFSRFLDYRKSTNTEGEACYSVEEKIKENRKQLIEWLQTQGLASAVIVTSLSDIQRCSTYAKEHGFIKEHFLLINDADQINEVFREMSRAGAFSAINKMKYDRIATAMQWLSEYYRAENSVSGRMDQNADYDHNEKIEFANDVKVLYESIPGGLGDGDYNVESLAKDEQDGRLFKKYPLIYIRLYNVLRELSKATVHGVSVDEMVKRIDRIARPATIEEILDNVSWATAIGSNYVFTYNANKKFVEIEEHNPVCDKQAVSTTANNTYMAVLRRHFQKGFRLDSALEVRKFRKYYTDINGTEVIDSDEEINRIIKSLCIMYDGKAFLPDAMLKEEVKEKLLSYIDMAFSSGKTAIFYQALYAEFAEEFLDCHIYNADMLKAYLEFIGQGRYYINRSYISKEKYAKIDSVSEVGEYLKESDGPKEFEEICTALAHLPKSKIKQILTSNREFINNGRGTYFHESIVRISEEDVENIASIIKQAISEKVFIGGNELYDAIRAKYPHIIEENREITVLGFRGVLKAKLESEFSFNGNIISSQGCELSMADVFSSYAQTHDSFSLAELQALASDLDTTIYLDPVYEKSLRISKEQFVSKGNAQFNVYDTDMAIDMVCTGKYIAIKEVTNFSALPYAGFPWNSFLLQHYVRDYSQKYLLLHSGLNTGECVGAIVKRDAGIETFDDLIVDILVNSNVEMKKESVLHFICEQGFLAHSRYSKIETLIIKANALRKRKDVE